MNVRSGEIGRDFGCDIAIDETMTRFDESRCAFDVRGSDMALRPDMMKRILENTKCDALARLLIQERTPRIWRTLRDAYILLVIEEMTCESDFSWQEVANRVENRTGCEVTPDLCRKVDYRVRSPNCG